MSIHADSCTIFHQIPHKKWEAIERMAGVRAKGGVRPGNPRELGIEWGKGMQGCISSKDIRLLHSMPNSLALPFLDPTFILMHPLSYVT